MATLIWCYFYPKKMKEFLSLPLLKLMSHKLVSRGRKRRRKRRRRKKRRRI